LGRSSDRCRPLRRHRRGSCGSVHPTEHAGTRIHCPCRCLRSVAVIHPIWSRSSACAARTMRGPPVTRVCATSGCTQPAHPPMPLPEPGASEKTPARLSLHWKCTLPEECDSAETRTRPVRARYRCRCHAGAPVTALFVSERRPTFGSIWCQSCLLHGLQPNARSHLEPSLGHRMLPIGPRVSTTGTASLGPTPSWRPPDVTPGACPDVSGRITSGRWRQRPGLVRSTALLDRAAPAPGRRRS
jgi:hypothetical protein